ncbi:MAG: glycosyltransferase [Pseudomonadota bacterium]
MMRICHVLPTFDPAHGGPLVAAIRLAESQAELGHLVTLAAFCRDTELLAMQRASTDSRVEIRGLSKTGDFRAILPFDIVELHGVWEISLLEAARVCRIQKTPYIVCPHGMLDHWSMQQKALKKRLALTFTHKRMLAEASAIHALNQHEAEVIGQRRLNDRIEVVPNGVDEQTGVERVDTQTDLMDLPHPGYVLFLGRLHYKKGLDMLATSWKHVIDHVPDATLVVAGPDEDGSIGNMRATLTSCGIDNSVVELGAIYGRDKWRLINDCGVFVLPSRQEGFSIAVLEALACGKPVVITTGCNFDEVQTEGAGLVCDFDPAQLSQALLTLMKDKELRGQMGVCGKDMVKRKYQWHDIAERSLNLYRSVVA